MFLFSIKSKVIFILLLISLAFVILSVILIVRILPSVIQNEIYKNVELTKHTEQYDRFLELPFPLTFKVYFFDVENPNEIVNGAKPLVKEKGPYVYKQYRKKTIKSIDENEDTISYTQREIFEFDAEASGNFSDEDYVTILNTPMNSILQIAEKYGHQIIKLLANCLNDIFNQMGTVFVKVRVKDILFDGVQFCVPHSSLCALQQTLVCNVAAKKKNVDKLQNNSLQFSFFNYKARSDDGLYTVKRGIQNIQTLGHIVKLNNSTRTNFWQRLGPNSVCDKVEGTDSTLYPPEISRDSVFKIYSTDICRYMEIRFLREDIYQGIKGYTFTTDNSTLRYRTFTEEKDCFCAKQTKGTNGEETCFLNGIIDIQPCTGVPVLLSFPHFLWADKTYRDNVDGIEPHEDLHRTYLIVEPETGTPLEGMKRIQINAVLRPVGNINLMKHLPRVVLPLLWIEEGVSLPNEYIEELNKMYFNKVKIVNVTKWAFLGISTIFTIIFSIYFLHKQCS